MFNIFEEACDSNQVAGAFVDQVFLLLKDYIQNLEMNTKEIEQKSKIDKEMAR